MNLVDLIIVLMLVVVISLVVYFSFIKNRKNRCCGCPYYKSCNRNTCKDKSSDLQ